MSAGDQVNETEGPVSCMSVESVSRISKFPVVESTISTATSIYSKVKGYNDMTNWTFSTAENTVYKAVEVGMPYATPVVSKFDGPIKKVDSLICSGLDYLETNIPLVKLPPGEVYESTKAYISGAVTPVVQTATNVAAPMMQTAKHLAKPAMDSAKQRMEEARVYVDPAVQSAKTMMEPYVQPAMDKAQAIKDYGTNKIGEFLTKERGEEIDEVVDCADCTENACPKPAPSQ